ncbi:hypothetical protein F5Y14DRAFT_459677 [Nemania sp. NC0429]|nr:hypothetical protein F5Y14DRAFT_459677 [Nemania sp. NC0429]
MDSQQSAPSSAEASRPASVPGYATYRPPTFQPTCTHLTMTRIYDPSFYCSLCRRPGHFDFLGVVLSSAVSPGSRGPERRASRFSFFEEISGDQMSEYSPAQVAIILKQKEALLGVLSRQHQSSDKVQRLYYPSGSHLASPLKPPPGFGFDIDTKPWVPRCDEECQAKFCHNCRPSCELRSYLSLDGILNGDVPPTAATGFGFHRLRSRPIIDARAIKDIGLRPVPWPRLQPQTYPSSPSSRSSWTLSDIIEDHVIEPGCIDTEPDVGPGSSALGSGISTPSRVSASERPRPAFTPPSTPTKWTGVAPQENGTTMFEHCPSVCDGRSPESLQTNDQVRHQVVKSIAGLTHQKFDEDETEEFRSAYSFKAAADQSKVAEARLAATAPELVGEESDSQGLATPMMIEELDEGRFHPDPLDVGDGIAVLEESVELGVPDVLTQM